MTYEILPEAPASRLVKLGREALGIAKARVAAVQSNDPEQIAELLLGGLVVCTAGVMAVRSNDPRARSLMIVAVRRLVSGA